MTQRAFKTLIRVECCKVAEYQSRGAIHFHAVIRLDAAGAGVAPPPKGFTVELLERAVHAVRERVWLTSPEMEALGKESRICWGRQIKVRPILETGAGELTAEAVADYTAKYAVKFSEGLGLPADASSPRRRSAALMPRHPFGGWWPRHGIWDGIGGSRPSSSWTTPTGSASAATS